MLNLREYRESTSRLPDRLPWAAIVAPGIVLQKDAILQKTIAFRGPDLASSLPSELVSASARINDALRRLGSGWGLFIEAQRFESNRYPKTRWPAAAAAIVDAERRRAFQAEGSHYESSYFLTFTWALPADVQERAAALFYTRAETDTDQADETALRRELRHFEKKTAEIVDILAGVLPEVGALDDEQTLSYLHSTISTHRHPVRVPEATMYLDALLPDMPLTPGEVPMLGEHFLSTSTITGFPGTTLPGLLDALNHLEVEYRWMTRFLCLDKSEAKSLLEKYRKVWWQKRKGLWTLLKEEAAKQESALIDNAAANKAADADAALQELGDDVAAFGYLTTTVTVWDLDLEQVRRKSQRVKEVIQSRGFVVRDETLNSVHAWLGSLPGHVYANVRRPIVSTQNLAHLMPLSAVWAGDDTNRHLESVCGVGTPHLLCQTTGSTPFRLHLAVGDVGHTLIIGPTGAGKSTLLGALALGWLQYPGAQVVIFDKDRSARAATLAVGGRCYEPGNERAGLAFQPLAHVDEGQERIWAAQLVATMLATQSVPLDPKAQAAIDDTLSDLAGAAPKERTMSLFATLLGSRQRALRDALRPYTLEGAFGSIFDADHDADLSSGASWTMIEMGALMGMGAAVVLPALEYLFRRVEGQFDGRPTLMIVDEAWLFLSHPVFAPRLQAWLKTLRKKNVYVVFATQEVADAASKPELLSTILSACHTKIFLPDEEATTPAMSAAYQAVGLTSAEIELLARAQKKRDYYYRSVKGRRLFQLGLGPAALAFVGASSPDDQAFFDQMIASGRAPADYAHAMLERRGVAWAAPAAGTPAVSTADAAAAPSSGRPPTEQDEAPSETTPSAPPGGAALPDNADTIRMPAPEPDEAMTIQISPPPWRLPPPAPPPPRRRATPPALPPAARRPGSGLRWLLGRGS